MSEQELYKLPEGWVWARIGDICSLINGRAFKPYEWTKQGLPIVRIQNLNDPTADFNYCDFDVDEKYLIDNGQLLFGWSGTPGTSFGAHIWNRGKAVLNQHIFRVEINEKFIDKFYLMNIFNYNISEYIQKAHGGVGLAHITKRKFENSFIPLPPLNEQKRIVTKLEELFSRLDAGVEALKKAREQLKRYRQSVLKSAFEGKLTEEWRLANKDKLEPASVLLERIKKERKDKLKELEHLDTTNLPALPEGWVWSRIGEVCLPPQYGWTTRAKQTGDLRLLRTTDITSGTINWNSVPFCEKNPPEPEKYLLNDKDILISRAGSIGLSILVKNPPKSVFASYLIRFRTLINPLYLAYFLQSPLYWKSILEKRLGITIPNINASKLREIILPLPPLEEQNKIVEEIERLFSIADKNEKIIKQSLKQADRLRQSTLKQAFEGKLVPQDPNDEPASILLERIREEKARYEKRKVNRKRVIDDKQMRLI